MSEWSDIAAIAVDASFDAFGHAATYTPEGGSEVECTVIVDLRDEGARPDDGKPIAGQLTIEVRASEIASPAKGGVFTFDGRSVAVMNRPMLDDEEALVWKMWAVAVLAPETGFVFSLDFSDPRNSGYLALFEDELLLPIIAGNGSSLDFGDANNSGNIPLL